MMSEGEGGVDGAGLSTNSQQSSSQSQGSISSPVAAYATTMPPPLLVPPPLVAVADEDGNMRYVEALIDPSDFEETRFEMSNVSYNLTSVLVNPRESAFYGDALDSFAIDQSSPLDYATNAKSLASSSSHASTHSFHMKTMAASSHTNINRSGVNTAAIPSASIHNSRYNNDTTVRSGTLESFWRLQLTATEEQQLQIFLQRMQEPHHALSLARASSGFSIPNMSGRGLSAPGSGGSIAGYKLSNLLIPEVLYSPEFLLNSPQIFDAILLPRRKSNSNTNKSSNNNNSNSNDNIDESNVSWSQSDYLNKLLDSVELTLLHNIWEKAADFFKVLDDVRTLQTLVSQVSQKVVVLRTRIDQLCCNLSLTAMRIPRLHTRQANEKALNRKLQSMQRLLQGRKTIQSLLDIEDYGEALLVVAACKKTYHDELRDIKVMQVVGMQLDDFDLFICDLMTNKFISLATQWVVAEPGANGSTHSNSTIDKGDELDMMYPSGQSAPANPTHAAFSRLVETLVQVGRFPSSLNLYKSRLADSLRLIIRACVLEYASAFDPMNALGSDVPDYSGVGGNSSGGGDGNLVARVRQMSTETFLSCLSMCYEQVLAALRRAESADRAIRAFLHIGVTNTECSVLDSSSSSSSSAAELEVPSASDSALNKAHLSPGASTPKQQQHQLELDRAIFAALSAASQTCVSASCEIAQKSISQLLSLRKDWVVGGAKVNVDKMKFLWEVSANFIDSLEGIIGSSAYTMRQTLLSHSKAFIDQMHEAHKASVALALDSERWMQCDVAPERQAAVERLVSGRMFSLNGGNSNNNNDNSSINSSGNSSGNISDKTTLSSSSGRPPKEYRPLVIDDGVQYNIVHSVLYLIELLMSYIDISFAFPPATGEIISKCIDLCRLFDSRTKQLVLGAQAIQSSEWTRLGLKSISAKHLAVTSQSVGLIRSLLPHVRTALSVPLPPKQQLMLVEFDRLSHELADHHSQIVNKFVSIVHDMADAFHPKLKSVNWDKLQGACEYFEEIVKNVSILHRVLIAILPQEQLQHVFSRIFSMLNRKITQHFDDITPLTTTGKQRIIDEIVHMSAAFSQLKGLQAPSSLALEEAFRKRYGGVAGI